MKALAKLTLAAVLAAGTLTACSAGSSDAAQQTKVAYVAAAGRAPFHRITCRWADGISPQHLQTLLTKGEAIKADHRPCKVCHPRILRAPASLPLGGASLATRRSDLTAAPLFY
jgi:hypothetical protein